MGEQYAVSPMSGIPPMFPMSAMPTNPAKPRNEGLFKRNKAKNPFLDPSNDQKFETTLKECRVLNEATNKMKASNPSKPSKENMKRFGLRDESKTDLILIERGNTNQWLNE